MDPQKAVVLIAEDDLDDQVFMEEALRSLGCDLYFFQDGEGLLLYLETEECLAKIPRLIIVDLNMPVVDGLECLRRIKSIHLYRDVPVLCFSTSSNEEDHEECEKLGAIGFVTKPSNYLEYKQTLIASAKRWIEVPTENT